jgi:hypothetical protein
MSTDSAAERADSGRAVTNARLLSNARDTLGSLSKRTEHSNTRPLVPRDIYCNPIRALPSAPTASAPKINRAS